MTYTEKSHPLLWQHLARFEQHLAQAQLGTDQILVGMSGGVDSSVTALILKALGYNVAGLFMKNWDEDDGTEYCSARQDLADAQAVADQLHIPLHTANFAAEYWDNVFEDFLASYKAGYTPNPDVLCNREIKFQVFREYAQHLGFNAIATGHYASIRHSVHGPQLLQSVDANKDQTYFLNSVLREQLAQVVFPLGCIEKPLVRELALEAGLATQRKKDSTGICFIGERRFRDFLGQYISARPGEICDENGKPLGEHQGLMYYTLGQRKGIGVGGVVQGEEKPWYVARKCLATNRLFIVQDAQHPWLMTTTVQLDSINWITPPQEISDALPWRGFARCRHRQALVPLTMQSAPNDARPVFIFDAPEWAVTPGQYLVLYQDGICLGGGPIMQQPEDQTYHV